MSQANPGYRDVDEIVRLFAVGAPVHIAVHRIEADCPSVERYSPAHAHSDLIEINVLLGEQDGLTYEMTLGDVGDPSVVAGPCAVVIPPGVPHSANFISGSGWFVVCRVRA